MRIREVFGSQLIAGAIAQADAITLYPFIFYLDKVPTKTVRVHEHIHVNQIKKNGWFKFYFTYLWTYLKNRWWLKMSDLDAYKAIPWEAEAYAHQVDWADQIVAEYPEIMTDNPPQVV